MIAYGVYIYSDYQYNLGQIYLNLTASNANSSFIFDVMEVFIFSTMIGYGFINQIDFSYI